MTRHQIGLDKYQGVDGACDEHRRCMIIVTIRAKVGKQNQRLTTTIAGTNWDDVNERATRHVDLLISQANEKARKLTEAQRKRALDKIMANAGGSLKVEENVR